MAWWILPSAIELRHSLIESCYCSRASRCGQSRPSATSASTGPRRNCRAMRRVVAQLSAPRAMQVPWRWIPTRSRTVSSLRVRGHEPSAGGHGRAQEESTESRPSRNRYSPGCPTPWSGFDAPTLGPVASWMAVAVQLLEGHGALAAPRPPGQSLLRGARPCALDDRGHQLLYRPTPERAGRARDFRGPPGLTEVVGVRRRRAARSSLEEADRYFLISSRRASGPRGTRPAIGCAARGPRTVSTRLVVLMVSG